MLWVLMSLAQAETWHVAGEVASEVRVTLKTSARPAPGTRWVEFHLADPRGSAAGDSAAVRCDASRASFTWSTPPTRSSEEIDASGNRVYTVRFDRPPAALEGTFLFTARFDGKLPRAALNDRYVIGADRGPDSHLLATDLTRVPEGELTSLVAEVTRGAVTQQQVVERTLSLVASRLTYVASPGDHGAAWSLGTGKGNCQNFSHLSLAILHGAGIAARCVTGFSLHKPWRIASADGEMVLDSAEGRHAWIEVRYPSAGWVPYDPQQTLHFVPARHIRSRTGADAREASDGCAYVADGPIALSETLSVEFLSDSASLFARTILPEPAALLLSAAAPLAAVPAVPTAERTAAPATTPTAAASPTPRPPATRTPSPELRATVATTSVPTPARVAFAAVPFDEADVPAPAKVDAPAFEIGFTDTAGGMDEYVTREGERFAQAFAVERACVLEAVELPLHRFGGEEGGLWVEVRRDRAGRPDSWGVKSARIATRNLATPGNRYPWIAFRSFASGRGVPLEPGRYWIVLLFDGDPIVNWRCQPGVAYGRTGDVRMSADGGATFSGRAHVTFNWRALVRGI